MNGRDIDQALELIHRERMSYPDTDAVIAHVLSAPIEHTSQRRAFLPTLRHRRFDPMSIATKSVVAGAVVALIGGFLLSGVSTQRQGEMPVPAAGSPSAEAVTSKATTPLAWERVEVPDGMGYESLRFSTGTYLIASSSDRTLVSRDGLTWQEFPWHRILDAYGDTLLVATVDGLSTVRLAGDAESRGDLPELDGLALPPGVSDLVDARIAYGPAGLVLVTCQQRCETFRTVWHTADGRSWKRATTLPRGGFEDVIATVDGFVARTDLGGRFEVSYSRDGRTWKRAGKASDRRYQLVGSAPFGTLLRMPEPDGSPARALALVTRRGLERLSVPNRVKERMIRSQPDGWGAGGLGVVGVYNGLVALTTDGATWHVGALPDSVPKLRFGDNGDGRPLLHVTEDVVLLETTVCLEELPDTPYPPYSSPQWGPEVDCPGPYASGQGTVWFRGVPQRSDGPSR